MQPITFVTVLFFAYAHARANLQKPGSQKVDPCSLPIESGPGRALLPMYAFDGRTCVPFSYGGLGGNANRFSTEEECLRACLGQVRDRQQPARPRPEQPRLSDVPDGCSLPMDRGIGRAAIPMFAFDGKNCVPLMYGGSGGNANRFFRKEDCENQCKRAQY
ncbi:hypothetical protein CRM22_003709 [Opisthorchis felineus]|uniref:BPTI/Kunitz inhibitor domain-containing protein n=1 Tax=Opisthorchis felineus TaxID=147828 RepID=A0A4S2M005_OPIFE|nr:hypothetical protein CRM22_003709 [Opisthorchis felineus]